MKTRMKKVLTIIGVTAVIYFALVGILYGSGKCPKYINVMPRIREPGELVKDILTWKLKLFFCPFVKKVW